MTQRAPAICKRHYATERENGNQPSHSWNICFFSEKYTRLCPMEQEEGLEGWTYPIEVLTMIMWHLVKRSQKPSKDIYSCMLVCSNWRAACLQTPVWEVIFQRRWRRDYSAVKKSLSSDREEEGHYNNVVAQYSYLNMKKRSAQMKALYVAPLPFLCLYVLVVVVFMYCRCVFMSLVCVCILLLCVLCALWVLYMLRVSLFYVVFACFRCSCSVL